MVVKQFGSKALIRNPPIFVHIIISFEVSLSLYLMQTFFLSFCLFWLVPYIKKDIEIQLP